MASNVKISDKYEMFTDEFLGKGSFSIVYKGINTSTKEFVAIKVINVQNLTSKAKKIVDDEIKILNIIKENPHPNIVECYDVVKKNNKIYLIMEYCDSGDLRRILKNPIKEKYTQFYFSQLANGLKYLDMQNIVHRDIKPRNILLTNNRKVLKIADFGFAKQAPKNINMYDTMCGSPLYMAPEIMGPSSYNKQTDLWSIGMILYEMLYGKHPLDKCKNITDLKYTINNTDIQIPPNNNSNKNVSDECLSLLRLLIQKDAKNRITWDDFFNHPWFGEYKYSAVSSPQNIRKNNKTYKEKICALSFGSLEASGHLKVSGIKKNLPKTPPLIDSKSVIIHDYYDSIFDDLDINKDIKDMKDIEDCIFKMDH